MCPDPGPSRPPEQEAGAPRVDTLRILATLGAALLVLGAPGLPAVLALRLRPLTALVAVVPFSLLAVAAAAEAGHLLGVPWSLASPLLVGLVLGAVLWLPGRRRPAGAAAADDGDEPTAAGPGSATGFLGSARGRAAAIGAGLVVGGGSLLA